METLSQENSSLKSEIQSLQGRLSKIAEMEQETMALELKRKFVEEHLHDMQGSRDALLSEKTSLNAELQQEKIAVKKLQKVRNIAPEIISFKSWCRLVHISIEILAS